MSNNTTSCSGGDLKPQKSRVPKRGPGVAELEKILKEEEGIGNGSDWLPENSQFSRDRKDSICPPPPVLTGPFGTGTGNFNSNSNLGFSVDRNFSSRFGNANLGGSGRILPEMFLEAPPLPWGTTSGGGGDNPNCNCKDGFGPAGENGGGRDMGRSAMVSPENQHFFPPFLSGQRRAETASDLQFLDQQKQLLQQQLSQFQHSMINFSPHTTLSSSSISSSAAGVEPPSNQRFYPSYPYLPTEENIQMSEGIKRQRLLHATLDNLPPPPPPFHGQIQSFPPQMQRSEPSFSVSDHGVFNLGTTSKSRDRIQSSNLEHNMRKATSDYDIMFGFPSALSSPFPSQEFAKGSWERSKAYRVREAEGSKPVYLFLQAGEEGMGAAVTGEEREDSIDLELKL